MRKKIFFFFFFVFGFSSFLFLCFCSFQRRGEEKPVEVEELKEAVQRFQELFADTKQVPPKQVMFRMAGLHAIERVKYGDELVVWKTTPKRVRFFFFFFFFRPIPFCCCGCGVVLFCFVLFCLFVVCFVFVLFLCFFIIVIYLYLFLYFSRVLRILARCTRLHLLFRILLLRKTWRLFSKLCAQFSSVLVEVCKSPNCVQIMSIKL